MKIVSSDSPLLREEIVDSHAKSPLSERSSERISPEDGFPVVSEVGRYSTGLLHFQEASDYLLWSPEHPTSVDERISVLPQTELLWYQKCIVVSKVVLNALLYILSKTSTCMTEG